MAHGQSAVDIQDGGKDVWRRIAASPLDVSRVYAWADRADRAVLCSCRDVARGLRLLTQQGGESWRLLLYLHHQYPCRFVHVVARIVAVTERTSHVSLLVDDGTAVIEVIRSGDTYRQTSSKPPRRARALVGERNSTAHLATDATHANVEASSSPSAGIPAEYLPPSPPKRRPHRPDAGAPPRSAMVAPTPWRPHVAELPLRPPPRGWHGYAVGMAIRCVGRVELDYDGRRRVVVNNNDNDASERGENMVEILDDPNAESTHILDRIHAASTTYTSPFDLGQVSGLGQPAPLSRRRERVAGLPDIATAGKGLQPDPLPPRRMRAAELRGLRALRGDDDDAAHETSRERVDMPGAPTSRRLESAPSSAPAASPRRSSSVSKAVIDLASSSPSAASTSSSATALSTSPRSSHRKRLRHHSKLPDAKVTDDLFRLYVQSWVVGRCGELPHPGGGAPRPFTLSYLRRVRDLRSLARRLVEVQLVRRRGPAATAALAEPPAPAGLTSEPIEAKVTRLFTWAVRHMVQDGVVVLGGEDDVARPPFDGRRPSRWRSHLEEKRWRQLQEEEAMAPPSSGGGGSASAVVLDDDGARSKRHKKRRRRDEAGAAVGTRAWRLAEAEELEWSDDAPSASSEEDERDGGDDEGTFGSDAMRRRGAGGVVDLGHGEELFAASSNAGGPSRRRGQAEESRPEARHLPHFGYSPHTWGASAAVEGADVATPRPIRSRRGTAATAAAADADQTPLASSRYLQRADDGVPRPRTRPRRGAEETYQLLQPSMLVAPLEAVLSSSSTTTAAAGRHRRAKPGSGGVGPTDVDAAQALEALRRSDERWRYVGLASVADALALLGGGNLGGAHAAASLGLPYDTRPWAGSASAKPG